jgi:uncharacterized membrane protein
MPTLSHSPGSVAGAAPAVPHPGTRWPEIWGVSTLLAFTVAAVVGYGVYGLNPERVPERFLGFWQVSFNVVAQGHILVGAAALLAVLVVRAGVRWVPAAGAVCIISFGAEHLSTGMGFPFGSYEYTHLLGPKAGGRVPWLIPLSWFLMALPALVLARATFPERSSWLSRILFAAVLLAIWDLALDPAMSYQMPFYWRWEDTGPYYGMPWLNPGGWLAVGIALMAAMEGLGAGRWGASLSPGWAAGYYGATLLMPVGMLVVDGLWLALAVTGAALGGAWGIHRWIGSPGVSGVVEVGSLAAEEGG